MREFRIFIWMTMIAGFMPAGGCSANRTSPTAEGTGASPASAAPRLTEESRAGALPIEVVREFWADGSPRLYREVVRSNDGTPRNHGRFELWFENGNPEYRGFYENGQLHGLETAWHRNGQKWTEQQYEHGVRHGYRRNWDEKGRLRGEEYYENGRPHGLWTLWKDDGTVKWQCRYQHGQAAAPEHP